MEEKCEEKKGRKGKGEEGMSRRKGRREKRRGGEGRGEGRREEGREHIISHDQHDLSTFAVDFQVN